MSLIDHGSYGKIFLQQDNTIVKELLLFSRDDIIGPATLRELNMHGLLHEYNCNNIIRLLRVNFKKDKVYLVMENGGHTLTKWLKHTTNAQSNFMSFFKQLVRGLYIFHILSFVHGDIKPDNIVIEEEKVKLIDFGGSFPYGKVTSDCMCTKSFRDPSLSEKNCIYHEKSDLFSLGLVIAYFISNEYFINESGYYDNRKYVSVITNSYLTQDIKEIVIKMGDPDPSSRPSFDELREKLGIEKIEKINADNVPRLNNFGNITVTNLGYPEYEENVNRIFSEFVRKGKYEPHSFYLTICSFLLISFFDRIDVNIDIIRKLWPFYQVSRIKALIIEIISTLNLVLYN